VKKIKENLGRLLGDRRLVDGEVPAGESKALGHGGQFLEVLLHEFAPMHAAGGSPTNNFVPWPGLRAEPFPAINQLNQARGQRLHCRSGWQRGQKKVLRPAGKIGWLPPSSQAGRGVGNASATAELWGMVADQPDATNSESFPPGNPS